MKENNSDENNSDDEDEACCDDEDFVCDEDWDEEDTTKLALRNYVENKHEVGVNPPLKNVRSLQVCRDAGFN